MEQYVFDTPMLLSAIIMTLTFLGIFTEGLHGFHRTKFAMLGAASMIIVGQIYGFYTPKQAIDSIDWNVVFLLGAMMTIVSIMLPTGGFEAIAYKIARFSKGKLFLLLTMLGTAVAVISLLLDNVTTVVIFGPIIVLIASALKVNPIPYLLAAALLSDTGGVATLVGDPPNLMIGSAKGIDFNTFFIHMSGIVFAAYLGTIFSLKFLFKKELSVVPEIVEFEKEDYIKDKMTWNASLAVVGIMVIFFIFHHALGWDAWMVATFGLTLLLFLAPNTDMDGAFGKIEITLLSFFMSLFVIIGGVEQTHFLEYLGSSIEPFVRSDLLMASLILMWGSAALSAMIDNIPFTAAMVPILLSFESQGIQIMPLWWALAIGVGMGGNGSHLGSTANVFIVTLSERLAKEKNDPSLAITPGLWFRKGTPAMIVTLILSSLLFWIFFDFFSEAI
ncbi:Arsenic efflux pump protein [hydrothermal vent metagenome]|uniref:Arsenic efflux pump protein n=1 Tax=hydrothermal vent metagenome TaxID=652676 RepID=A0A1W1CH33_9ZZZZ